MPERKVDKSYAERFERLEREIRFLKKRTGQLPSSAWKFTERNGALVVRHVPSGTTTTIAVPSDDG